MVRGDSGPSGQFQNLGTLLAYPRQASREEAKSRLPDRAGSQPDTTFGLFTYRNVVVTVMSLFRYS